MNLHKDNIVKNSHHSARTVARDDGAPELAYARVSAVNGEWIFLNGTDQNRARVAAGCLLNPEVGDTVLVSIGGHASRCFVLSVLERSSPESAEIGIPGGGRVICSEGKMRFESESIEFSAQDQLLIEAESTRLESRHMAFDMEVCRGAIQSLEGDAEKVTLRLGTFMGHFDKLLSRMKESLKWVDGLDEYRVGRSRLRVKGDHDIRATDSRTIVESTIRLDGKKINIG